MVTTMTSPSASSSQTLSRGIQALEVLSEAPSPLSIAQLASALGVHRSIAYRILRTLEDHGLVLRNGAGLIQLGPRLAALARSVSHDLQAAALPELTTVANELSMTAFVAVLDHRECVTLVSVEPRSAHATVAQRPGTRHPIWVGAPGIAIQSILSDDQWRLIAGEHAMRAEVGEARTAGFATSHDEVIPGLASVSVPIGLHDHAPCAISVVYVATLLRVDAIARRLTEAAEAIAKELN
jgi:DNA-binding IclR family transcriptional regulator